MYAGQIVESGSVEAIFNDPKHPYTQKLLKAIPRLDQPKDYPLEPIEGTPPNLSYPLPGCGFCARCPHAMHICKQENPPLLEVEPNHHTACFQYDPRFPRA